MGDLTADIRVGAARVAGIYLAVAIAWIVLSDLGALSIVFDPITLTGVQTAKGVFFVTASAGLLYVLIAREQRRLAETNAELALTIRHASVLHRLLRHNLRNSCDVILNNVALLREDRADPDAAYDRIDRQTTALVDIAEKSRHMRDLVLADDPTPQSIDIGRIVRDRIATVIEDFPKASITLDGDGDTHAVAHPRIGIAIEEVLRNSVTHANSDDPSVAVSLQDEDDVVTLEVTDDGPGLPPMELIALDGSVEEPLEHSRGIGLWLVQFLVSKSDGTLEARANGDSGTVVRMSFDGAT